MPRRDGTGPAGAGPLTGRGLGPCSGNKLKYIAGAGAGIGLGLGLGLGLGRRRRGLGGGRGRGLRAGASAFPKTRK